MNINIFKDVLYFYKNSYGHPNSRLTIYLCNLKVIRRTGYLNRKKNEYTFLVKKKNGLLISMV